MYTIVYSVYVHCVEVILVVWGIGTSEFFVRVEICVLEVGDDSCVFLACVGFSIFIHCWVDVAVHVVVVVIPRVLSTSVYDVTTEKENIPLT